MDENAQSPAQPIPVDQVLAYMLDQIADLAWQKLGLRHDPMTNSVAKDLAQAKLAIDATDALIKVLRPELDEADQRQLDNLSRDLKMNFVSQSSGAGS